MKSSQQTISELTDLASDECGYIHFIDQIQPYSLLMAVQDPDFTIVYVSQNTQNLIGIEPQILLGQHLSQIFTNESVEAIAKVAPESLVISRSLFVNPVVKPVSLESSEQIISKPVKYLATIHYSNQQLLIIELEPISYRESLSLNNFCDRLKSSTTKIKQGSTSAELYTNIVEEVHHLTGFDRVMLYKFAHDFSGVVVAEAANSVLESYLGLHFPAADIPPMARNLFAVNRLRIIPDINYQPVPILAIDPKAALLDLSKVLCRGVHPFHVEYLENMALSASMTISLICENKLWGLIACHHSSPKLLDYETRQICEVLGQIISEKIIVRRDRELLAQSRHIKYIETKIREDLTKYPHRIYQIFKQNQGNLLELVKAQGVAVCLGAETILFGDTASEAQVTDLVTWLRQRQDLDIFYTDSLPEIYPKNHNFPPHISGILATSILLKFNSYHIIWFRVAQTYAINWAGNPHETVSSDPEGIVRLSPRGSFTVWQELVQKCSLPWEQLEIDAGRELRNSLLVTALESSQQAWQIAAQQAQAANKAKSEFLANMSHEIRTPLNAILGFTQLLEMEELDPDLQSYLKSISQSGESLITIINDILDLSKLESGEIKLEATQFEVRELVAKLINLFQPQAIAKGILLTESFAQDVPDMIIGPLNRLQQVLTNLIGNAIKFTESGSISVRIAVEKSSASDSLIKLRFNVQDTGIGISPEFHTKIFEPFSQVDSSSTRQYEGTGLGLTICRKIVTLMDGEMDFDSTVGKGSTFWFTSTFNLPAHTQFKESKPMSITPNLSSNNLIKVLVVEDYKLNQKLMIKILQSLGYQAEGVNNGQLALESINNQNYDVVLMDCQMPVLDGYETTQQIRLLEAGEPHRTVIIGVTAYAMSGDREKCLAAGMDDYISKPVRIRDLVIILEKWLGKVDSI